MQNQRNSVVQVLVQDTRNRTVKEGGMEAIYVAERVLLWRSVP